MGENYPPPPPLPPLVSRPLSAVPRCMGFQAPVHLLTCLAGFGE